MTQSGVILVMGNRPVSYEAVMSIPSTLRGLRTLALSVVAGIAIVAPAQSDAATHYSGGGFHGGVGGVHSAYGFHGGYGYRGGFGYRGYGFRGFYGPGFGWGWGGFGAGLFLASLPLYYSTWWWNGVPYYYAYDNYYTWNGPAGQYEQVAPPAGLVSGGAPAPSAQSQGAGPMGGTDLFAYPKNGQSAEQQARDKQECRDWAATQTGGTSGGAAGAIASASPQGQQENLRAQAACLEGRGYSVK
jgi:hypothetical protein